MKLMSFSLDWRWGVRVSLLMLFATATVKADVVLDWNEALRAVVQSDTAKANPGWSTRSMAMMNGAIYDAFQAVQRTHVPFYVDMTNPSASQAAASTQAAFEILAVCYPGAAQAAILSDAYTTALSGIADGPAKDAGIVLGASIAQQYLGWRDSDGADQMVAYMPTALPGRWQPDPFNPKPAWGPEWGGVTPFTLTSSQQFAVPGVPDMSSQEYVDAFNQVKMKGALTGSTRTPDEEAIGIFWAYDRAGMGPPPVLYNRNLHEIAMQTGNAPADNARLFAMASVAMADAAIAAWDVKFVDDFWRPVTAIRAASDQDDDNPATVEDGTWQPLGAPGDNPLSSTDDFTPPFPAYVSGHATMGGATYEVLRRFYGGDDLAYTLTSEEMPVGQESRSFTSFSTAEYENAISRIYLGIHWLFDADDGVALGNDIAEWVESHHFQPVPEPASWAIGCAAIPLIALGRRIRRRTLD